MCLLSHISFISFFSLVLPTTTFSFFIIQKIIGFLSPCCEIIIFVLLKFANAKTKITMIDCSNLIAGGIELGLSIIILNVTF